MKSTIVSKTCTLFFSGVLTIFCLSVCLPSPAFASEQNNPQSASLAKDMPIYNPPVNNGEIRRREAGDETASRGLSRGLTRGKNQNEGKPLSLPSRMSPFAPQGVGFTSKPQPVLQWYISGPWHLGIEFRLVDADAREDVFSTRTDCPVAEGVYQISLKDHNIRLNPGTEYEWFLIIVPDDEERSGDFVGSGVIKYVEPGNALSERLRNTPTDRLHNLYAEQGYWYDAIENLSQRIHHAGTGDKTFRLHRAALLRQVNLPLAAAYDSL